MMTREEYLTKLNAMLVRGILPGDVIESAEEGPAIVRTCQWTNKPYVIAAPSCIADFKRGPRCILVAYSAYRGGGLKVYVDSSEPIHAVRIVKVSPRSARGVSVPRP